MWSVAEAIVKHRVHLFIASSAGNGKHNTSSGFMVVQGFYTPTMYVDVCRTHPMLLEKMWYTQSLRPILLIL